jgi:hypothetical protein
MSYEWAVLWGGIVIFLILPAGVLGYAYWIGSAVDEHDDMDHIGSMDVDHRLKRFKDQ